MSLKQEIEVWVQASEAYDKQDYTEALQIFSNIADTSRILFNCGVIHATLGEHDRAVDCYRRATQLDQYLAVAYFQEGVSNFLKGASGTSDDPAGDLREALANFNDTLLYLRGNRFIDYEQLGLKFKLYSCEVLFNRGLCYMYLQEQDSGMKDFEYALKEKMTADHEVIDEAIRENAENYTVFSIPVGIIYKPNEAKVKNLKQKDYLGRARLVATANASNVSTGFQGADRRAEAQKLNMARDDRPQENISFAATNLVNKNIVSRRDRDRSAPPTIGRPTFPPTPPPESENKAPQLTSRSMSMRLNTPRNLQLNGLSNGRTATNEPNPGFSAAKRTDTMASDPGMRRPAESSAGLGLSRQDTFDFDLNNTPQVNRGASRFRNTPRLNTNLDSSARSIQGPWSAVDERPRMGSMRSSSETRDNQSSGRRPTNQIPQSSTAAPRPLFAEQRRSSSGSPGEADAFDDVYAMYGSGRTTDKRASNRSQRQHQYIAEEDEDIIIESDSADESQTKNPIPNGHARARPSMSRRESKTDMKKIRVKVHASDDIRYIMINGTTIDYDDFESKVRAKFGLRGRLRMKTKDEDCGDMITMADQDDLDSLVTSAKDLAKREKSEIGKMEVWVQESL